MFDEEEVSQPATPVSLPAASDEIPDIFDGSQDADASPETTVGGPSALDAGKLSRTSTDPFITTMGAASASEQPSADLHEPAALKRIVIATVILLVVGGVGAAVWYFVIRKSDTVAVPASVSTPAPASAGDRAAAPAEKPTPASQNKDIIDVDAIQPVVAKPPAVPTPDEAAKQQVPVLLPAVPSPSVDSQKDTDHDGLTDEQELKRGTDANNPDTDADGLIDGAEVNIWGTDPLNKDTDADGFSDGQEVLNGFNPKGPGKAH